MTASTQPSNAETQDRLRGAGLRPTRQRIDLANLLLRGPCRHVTAEELFVEATAANVSVSLATVYNTLHQFVDAGLLREVLAEPGRAYFDTDVSDHHHFFHVREGRLEDIPADAVVISALPAAPKGARIGRVDVIIRLEDSAD
ncbi:MAG: iron response transcriptional regulator IrrA [Alphaproteobacteria bacterium]